MAPDALVSISESSVSTFWVVFVVCTMSSLVDYSNDRVDVLTRADDSGMFPCGTDCSHDLSYAVLDLEGAIASAFERKRKIRAEKDKQRMEMYLLVSFLVTAMPCLKPSLLALAIASAASGRTLADGMPTADTYFGLLFRELKVLCIQLQESC